MCEEEGETKEKQGLFIFSFLPFFFASRLQHKRQAGQVLKKFHRFIVSSSYITNKTSFERSKSLVVVLVVLLRVVLVVVVVVVKHIFGKKEEERAVNKTCRETTSPSFFRGLFLSRALALIVPPGGDDDDGS